MRSLRAALAAPLAALALLTGCTDDDPSPGDPTSTWTPTSKPETPTTSATAKPTEPALPKAATKATEDGARAFITYYWDLINYAQATGDVATLKRNSARSCVACQALAKRFETQYAAGGAITGGINRPSVTKLVELTTPSESAFGFQSTVDVSHDALVSLDGSGGTDERAAGSATFRMILLWVDEAKWRVDVLEAA